MCGIAGYIGKLRISPDARTATLKALRNRGPDNADAYQFESEGLCVYLLHTRLSIVDLETRSNQPFRIGDHVLTFNGEIYNYVELRAELQRLGEEFTTQSDTEVLLRGIRRYGISYLDKCEGMWAFALFDECERRLVLSRDRFGEKPLLVRRTSDGIYFASESSAIKTISAKSSIAVDEEQVRRYLHHGFRSLFSSGHTFYRDVRHIPSAGVVTVNSDLTSATETFWKPVKSSRSILSFEEAAAGVRERLVRSMCIRMRSDVPIAFCLSGGVDSGSLVSIATKVLGARVHTFSIVDEDPRYDESTLIQETVTDTGCDNTTVRLNRGRIIERLRRLVAYHDAPVSTISYLIHSMLSEVIGASGFRVAISGTGADEIVTGYFDHFLLHLASVKGTEAFKSALDAWRTHIEPLVRSPQLKDLDRFLDSPQDLTYLSNVPSHILACIKKESSWKPENIPITGSPIRDRMAAELFREIVPVILWEDDLNSMLFSVENRSPFLDRSLYEFCMSIDDSLLIRDGRAKAVLREAMRGILNEPVRKHRQKTGFNASINSLVDFEDTEIRQMILQEGPLYQYVDRDKLIPLLKGRTTNEESKFLFNVLNAKLFLEMN